MKKFSTVSRNSESGFALIQILVASVLIGIISLGIGNMFSAAFQQSALLASRFGRQSAGDAIRMQIQRSDLCRAAVLPATNFAPAGNATYEYPVVVKLSGGTLALHGGVDPNVPEPYIEYSIAVRRLFLNSIVPSGIPFVDAGLTYQYYLAQIVLDAEPLRAKGQLSPLNVSRLFLKVNTANNSIADCSSGENAEEVSRISCESLSGIYNNQTRKCDLTQTAQLLAATIVQQAQAQLSSTTSQLQTQLAAAAAAAAVSTAASSSTNASTTTTNVSSGGCTNSIGRTAPMGTVETYVNYDGCGGTRNMLCINGAWSQVSGAPGTCSN